MRPTRSEDFYIRILLQKTKVREVMATPVISVQVDEPFRKVVALMQEKNIRHIPIVNEAGQLVGLLSQRDVYKIQSPRKLDDGRWYFAEEDLAQIKLSRVMVKEPKRVSPDDTLADAVKIMVQGKYGCLPVVQEEDVLCGILTQFDFLKMAGEILQE